MARLYLLDLGTLDLDPRVIAPASAARQRIRIPVPGYLVQTEAATVLVDTGMSREVLSGADNLGPWMRPVKTAGAYVVDRLAALGVRPADVTHVVATHFHFDHAGALDALPNAAIVAQRAAVEAVRTGGPRERAIVENEALRWQLVEGDCELAPGVRLLETNGHTVGHQSVLVTTGTDGAFLLAIDAIYNRAQLAAGDWGAYVDPEAAQASAHKVRQLARETSATLIYGHDAEQWAGLRHAPDYYE